MPGLGNIVLDIMIYYNKIIKIMNVQISFDWLMTQHFCSSGKMVAYYSPATSNCVAS